jgi:hypothetical protein
MRIENCKLKIIKILKIFLPAVFLVALGFFSMAFYAAYKNVRQTKDEKATISNEQSRSGKVLAAQQAEETSGARSNMFSSQNFRAPQISIGGEAVVFPAGQQSEAPEILDMRSELLTTKSDQQVKFLLSWRTNKLCQSSIEYRREGQTEGKVISEDGYGFIHSVEIAPLSYSTSYSYIVTARDKWGNEVKSDKLTFYTGAPKVSIFDLLGGAFKEMFGWVGR